MSENPAPCRFLAWDSEFFGKRVARYEAAVLDDASWTQARSWCQQQAIDCLYLAAPLQGPITRRIAGEPGVVLADVRVLLERTGFDVSSLGAKPDGEEVSVRLGTVADLPALRPIAATGHADSRFYQDPGFADRAPALFARWIERSFEGFAEVVWVAECAGVAVGYVTCSREGETGSIGLVGVAASQRGKGLGPRLIAAALAWFADQRIKTVTVVTQGSNLTAQRLYLRAGFLPRSLSLWFHCWRTS
jgi:dTDP-4-amino-4,6-dideoxy-D-galactose acyltransferase